MTDEITDCCDKIEIITPCNSNNRISVKQNLFGVSSSNEDILNDTFELKTQSQDLLNCSYTEINRLKEKIEYLEKENLKLSESMKYMSDIIQSQQEKIDLLNEENMFEDKFRNVLSKMFTQSQINIILKKPKKVQKWTNEDIAYSMTLSPLRSISPKAYRFLRQSLEFPLPGLSTLSRWASTFNIERGILTDVLSILKNKGLEMSPKERVTVISFDETYISSKICFDKKN